MFREESGGTNWENEEFDHTLKAKFTELVDRNFVRIRDRMLRAPKSAFDF